MFWVEAVTTGNTMHVLPRNDSVFHESSEDCACGPEIMPVPARDGSMGWVITHHSLDNRESAE